MDISLQLGSGIFSQEAVSLQGLGDSRQFLP